MTSTSLYPFTAGTCEAVPGCPEFGSTITPPASFAGLLVILVIAIAMRS